MTRVSWHDYEGSRLLKVRLNDSDVDLLAYFDSNSIFWDIYYFKKHPTNGDVTTIYKAVTNIDQIMVDNFTLVEDLGHDKGVECLIRNLEYFVGLRNIFTPELMNMLK